jgi:hypothetical protein
MALDIIGRDEEFAVLNAFIRRTDDGLHALVLEGAAGIGKSTLWLAGISGAREQGIVFSARVRPQLSGDSPTQESVICWTTCLKT